ncbi:hypothetical protein [Aquibacillus kalidii]|uniref:hypothetical protein n=1 Tax=Aquibacillus kalidii TaxID=2762597 RepID=UPI001C992A7E|nr:hypothetical protein [Aquibacillus kalidii]
MSFYFYHSKKLYGNDKDSIVRVIKSIEGYENKQIKVTQIDDFDKVRIVGFLSNNSPSYIEFQQNKKGNYVWKHIESRKDEAFSMFLPSLGDLMESSKKIMFVTNHENEIARMQVDINGETLDQSFTPYQASITWVDLPQINKHSYEYRNYKYYDKNGNLIREK